MGGSSGAGAYRLAGRARSRPPMKLVRLHHVTEPEEWPEVVARYQALFGTVAHHLVQGLAVFDRAELQVVIEARTDDPADSLGEDRLAWEVDDLDAQVARLVADGWRCTWGPDESGWGRVALLRDPGGSQVELVEG